MFSTRAFTVEHLSLSCEKTPYINNADLNIIKKLKIAQLSYLNAFSKSLES